MLELKWNDNWKFWKKGDSFALTPAAPEDALVINLPHDAMIAEAAYAESRNGTNTGYRDGGVYTYEKVLSVAESEINDTFIIKFEGVYMNALVYVNGQLAGRRPYGYSVFYVTLNDYLVTGDNFIRVEVRNSAMTNSRWYSGSGIYRDVYLLKGKEAYIVQDGVLADTVSVEQGNAHLEIKTKVRSSSLSAGITIKTEILNMEGCVINSVESAADVTGGDEQIILSETVIQDVSLWSAENPYLYTVKTYLYSESQLLDENIIKYGARTLKADAASGLYVNNEKVVLRGACIHHDNGLIGAAEYEETAFRRVRKLKAAGFNAIRMSHHPMSPALLRACDTLGMYVMDESFDMWTRCKSDSDYALWFGDWWERDLESMVYKDYNHPSVIMYSLGNEIPDIGFKSGIKLLKAMNDKVKSIDKSRFTTIAVNGIFAAIDKMDKIMADVMASLPEDKIPKADEGGNVNSFMTIMDNCMDDIVSHKLISDVLKEVADSVDISGYNYMTGRYETDRDTEPSRVIVGSETYPPEIGRNWNVMKTCPGVIGDFTWTGWDYIGEAGIGVPGYKFGEGGFGAQYPVQLAFCGDIDITGYRRPASYYKEIVFGLRKEPYIAVQDPAHYGEHMIGTNWVFMDGMSSWTFEGMEGKPAIVEVYSASEEVELFINGESLGRKTCGPDNNYKVLFDVTYNPGVIKAVSYDDGKESGAYELRTAGEASLKITEEPRETAEGAAGLYFYSIELTDEDGILNTSADREITITVTDGNLLGFGSADPRTAYNYNVTTTKTYKGRAQAVVISDGGPKVTVC
ncbi:MAG: DUF4982 domain-containing protein [Parasporobacterium sp.]|nr:DUF4982 domain-containing protein [Parasporobacterium sp.]